MRDIIQFLKFKFAHDPIFARKSAFLAGRITSKSIMANIVFMSIVEEAPLLLTEKTKK